MKKKKCAVCGRELSNCRWIQVARDGKAVKVCYPTCAGEVLKNEKNSAGVNRMLHGRNMRIK